MIEIELSGSKYIICNDGDKIVDQSIVSQLENRKYKFSLKSSGRESIKKYLYNQKINFVGFVPLNNEKTLVSVPKGKNVNSVNDNYIKKLEKAIGNYVNSEIEENSYKPSNSKDTVVQFDKVFEWLLSEYLYNQIKEEETKVSFISFIDSSRDENGKRVESNLDDYKVYDVDCFVRSKKKYDIPDIVCDSKEGKNSSYCMIIDAKYHKRLENGKYTKLDKIDVYKQFFYEGIIRSRYERNETRVNNIKNIFIVPMYEEQEESLKWDVVGKVIFDYYGREIDVVAINTDELLDFTNKKNNKGRPSREQNTHRNLLFDSIKKGLENTMNKETKINFESNDFKNLLKEAIYKARYSLGLEYYDDLNHDFIVLEYDGVTSIEWSAVEQNNDKLNISDAVITVYINSEEIEYTGSYTDTYKENETMGESCDFSEDEQNDIKKAYKNVVRHIEYKMEETNLEAICHYDDMGDLQKIEIL